MKRLLRLFLVFSLAAAAYGQQQMGSSNTQRAPVIARDPTDPKHLVVAALVNNSPPVRVGVY